MRKGGSPRRVFLGLSLPALTLCGLVGVGLGAGTFTVHYASAFAYLSDDPKACVHCHIMREPYDDWQKAGHHAYAVCNDCHLAHDSFVAKWASKAQNGFNHSKAFTFQDFREPIRIHEHNSRILQANCVRCHDGLVSELIAPARHADGVDCVHCHQAAGHGPGR